MSGIVPCILVFTTLAFHFVKLEPEEYKHTTRIDKFIDCELIYFVIFNISARISIECVKLYASMTSIHRLILTTGVGTLIEYVQPISCSSSEAIRSIPCCGVLTAFAIWLFDDAIAVCTQIHATLVDMVDILTLTWLTWRVWQCYFESVVTT